MKFPRKKKNIINTADFFSSRKSMGAGGAPQLPPKRPHRHLKAENKINGVVIGNHGYIQLIGGSFLQTRVK